MNIRIPLNWLSMKHRCADILKLDVEKRQKLFWKKDNIIEFWMEGFNDDMEQAFKNLVDLHDEILYKDPYWHFFYESHYSLVRCSMRFRDQVRKFLDKRNVQYKWPISNWNEGLYITSQHQERFKHLFHNFSMLVIEMYKNDDGKYLYSAADRVCHCFLNHALYLANDNGALESYRESDSEVSYWEATMMASLTAARSYHIGTIDGENTAVKRMKERIEADKKEE